MSIPLARIRTEAETELARQFAAAPRDAAQTRDFAVFERIGLPHRRLESWHYTDLRARLRHAAALAPAPSAGTLALAKAHPLLQGAAARIVLVDGRYVPALSDAPAHVRVCDLDAGAADLFVDLEGAADDAVVALNGALLQGGVAITVADRARIAGPIEIVSLQSAGGAVFQRVVARLGAGAEASFVERFAALGEGPTQMNAAFGFDLADDAKLTHAAETATSADCVTLASVGGRLAKRSVYDCMAFVAGAGLVRRQMFLRFQGPHAKAMLRGVTLLDDRLHADTTLVVDHAAPHCESRERFRHIVDGEATGVFQGKIIVRPGAQKTDGGMKSDALLLSDGASMSNKPELEIFADDVVCGHGATVGQLDEGQVFYLRARGLPRREAEALLVEAFAAAIIDETPEDSARETMRAGLTRWLAARSGA